MSNPSVTVHPSPKLHYLLRLGDTCLILGQRLSEWCGHAPVLEEDIALANMALDLIGQSRAVLTLAGQHNAEAGGPLLDEDQLAFLREEREYFNLTMVELPKGDFAFTVVRNTMTAAFLTQLWSRLTSSTDPELAGIAGKALKESRYHLQHAGDWLVRLGDGTPESKRRTESALAQVWRYAAECFDDDAVDVAAKESGLGPAWSELQAEWHDTMLQVLNSAGLRPPAPVAFRSRGKQGVHSEHMGHLLSNMQYLQRAFPGGAW